MLLFFLTAFCASCTGFNLFGARTGAPCRAVTPCRTILPLPPAQMSSTPNESKWHPQRVSAALKYLRANTVDHTAGAMPRQLSSWLHALKRFRVEPSPTDEEVQPPPATSKEAAPREEPDAEWHAEFDEIDRELDADLKIRDALNTMAQKLQDQGEFRAADLVVLEADALDDQIGEKLARSADLLGLSETAEDMRAGRSPVSFWRSSLESTYSVRRRPAPADASQPFLHCQHGGSHTTPGAAC